MENDLVLSEEAYSYLNTSLIENVLTIQMNRPEKLNGWTLPMMDAIKEALGNAASRDSVKVVILTGSGKYYSAGVDLGGSLKLMHPRKLRDSIIDFNQQLFDTFIEFPKPILVAVNGPAIGASVTSATLCDGIVASENATFSTPFAKLGVPPEGCSSVQFAMLMGDKAADRMLGNEGWKPNAAEALDVGLAQWQVEKKALLDFAMLIAKSWVAESKPRTFLTDTNVEQLKDINAKESVALADAFLRAAFFKNQTQFFWKKKKYLPALVFYLVRVLRPIWARML